MASGLETLHGEKMIHRDIKLQNIFVTEDGNFKLGMQFFLFHHYVVINAGYYGISRRDEGGTMTEGVGTKYVVLGGVNCK
jgi:serine/threonine protein kinase